MATPHEGATEGGPKGPSESVTNDQKAMANIARVFTQMVVGQDGELTPQAQAQMDLRSDESRARLVNELVSTIAPDKVGVELWAKWVSGGDNPFTQKGLVKPTRPSHGMGKAVSRGPASLRPYQDKVAKAEADLAFAREELAYKEAMDKGLMTWVVNDLIIRTLSPIFAMGPAWTIMRALSPDVDQQTIDSRTAMCEGQTKIKAIEQLREAKQKETDEILRGLDFWSGDRSFEAKLRLLIMSLLAEFKSKEEDAKANGRKARSREDLKTTVNPLGKEQDAKVTLDLASEFEEIEDVYFT